jgi:sugar transferase (PEP-CTERM/EpsH1 system associated)
VPNLLFLSHRIPYPPDKGEKIRAWHIFEHLARTYRIHLGCFIDDPRDWGYVPVLREYCADIACVPLDKKRQKLQALLRLRPGISLTQGYFHSRRLQHWVANTLVQQQIDRIFVFCSSMACYLPKGCHTDRTLDMVDVDSEKWAEFATRKGWPMRWLWAREARTLLALERRAAACFDRTLFVSEDECRRFVSLAPEAAERSDWVENGVDLAYFSPSHQTEDPFPDSGLRIVFTGTMDYWPNADAVGWFVREVIPILREWGQSPSLSIVGSNPGPETLRLAEVPGVRVTGRVPDVRPYIAHATVVVAPLHIARGVQNKVLEAMAMGKPVVASPASIEGLRAVPGRDLLVAEGALETAQSVLEVLQGRHPNLGAAARQTVENGYRWPATLAKLDMLLGHNAAVPTRVLLDQAP